MAKSKTAIVSYSLLTITGVLAIYLFFKTQQLNKELLQVNKKVQELEDPNVFKQPVVLERIDSLLLKGEYTEALSAYQKYADQVNDIRFTRALQIRMNLARQLLHESTRQDEEKDTASTVIAVTFDQGVTPEEVRQFDSLNFALDKAHMQITYLEQRLKESTEGAYLTFTTSKGKQVHYVGQIKNKMAYGRGVALLSTGSRYEGQWKNNLRHGNGTFYWPDGQYYKGQYEDDKRHGLGTYHWPNGERFKGQWQNDQRNGEGTFFDDKGEVVAKGIWRDDELVKVDKR